MHNAHTHMFLLKSAIKKRARLGRRFARRRDRESKINFAFSGLRGALHILYVDGWGFTGSPPSRIPAYNEVFTIYIYMSSTLFWRRGSNRFVG